ncbi:TPA: phage repressor protein CI [Yersinia enterocolitica]|uniref:phage repressor protein CI n=1 Tax=Yersinia enterocolitica TaxID=630 RepID=UPI0005E26F29|nr:phage repressor protein CI [Yersinia enterocolitica]ELI8163576.1 phage repressor protein CI [Yersinia enterocolitica]CQH31738.1 CI repressor [Yersinia enterocolitica]CQI12235.1 CI repressor [Yersinia enterocolitica]HDL6906289.1 phage repressor protein CI [Yersinia enterocolitica]HDL6910927.1 phage repressor protein CI [Yersinia enterocolitica]
MDLTKSHASQIVERLISSYRVSSQKELAECLGIPANTISGWVKRDAVSSSSIIKCSLDTGAELRWLLSGKFENSNLKNEKCNISLKGKGLYEQVLQSGGKAVLRRILDAYGFSTQKELGDLLGIPTGTISTWIRRDFFPGDVVVTCALDTGVSLEWLATGKGNMSESKGVKAWDVDLVKFVPKKQLKAGTLEDIGEWVTDSHFISSDIIKPVYIEGKPNSWLADFGLIEISNGRWLLDIEGKYDVYDVTLYPGRKIDVTNRISKFRCGIDDVKTVGRISLTIENNY